ncbi:MAG: CcmD family protein [Tunicatimonas sp.]
MPQPLSAQPEPTADAGSTVEMADIMRQEGKIYVVVAVMLLLFSGFVVYTIRIDQKVSRLEKELHNETP